MATAPEGFPSHFARMVYALELRREGKTYREIADRCHLKTEQSAQKLISNSIKRVLRETAEEVRSVEMSRLEALLVCLWDRAITDAEVGDFRRFDRVRQLVEAKLKWCGAQPVIDGMEKDNRVTINIVSYTDNRSVGERPANVKDSRLTLEATGVPAVQTKSLEEREREMLVKEY